ncbi:MAG: HYR domain-containing protein, partial [Bacteroidetes bacterium]|nr:HYR domain-containing protein [Bacteroidota bacterium]
GTPLPIGETEVFVTVVDEAGNESSCSFMVTVLEHTPGPGTGLACQGAINVSLGPDCTREIVAEMILVGGDYACYDNYEVTLCTSEAPDAPMLPSSPFVTESEIGDTVVVKVCDTVTGECCWGYVIVDFYQAPTFDCPADTTLSCIASTDPVSTGEPVLTSCALGGASISFTDEVEDNGDCADPRVVITRSWRVEDAYGNFTTCEQVITVAAFELDSIVFPADVDGVAQPALSCEAVSATPSLTHPDNTGYPTLDGTDEVFGLNFCSASFLYTDEIFNICEGSYEILRTWKVRNTCGPVIPGENPREHIQLIRVLDNTIPSLACPDTQYVSTSSFNCRASYLVPPPDAVDGCSEITYTVSTTAGALSQLPNGQYLINDLPVGTHTITYRVQDACGRTNSCSYPVAVEDQVEPTAVCDDQLNVSIGGGGYAQVAAEDFNEGSWDACGIADLSVRRAVIRDSTSCDSIPAYFTEWADLAAFNCCDIGDLVRIELRVTDEAGNSNICWQEVLVEDKIEPYCQAPDAVSVSCTDLPLDFPSDLDSAFAESPVEIRLLLDDLFGMPTGIDNCSVSAVEELPPTADLECKAGTITRRFKAVDAFGNESTNACEQLITVTTEHEFEIEWPADAEAVCGVATPDSVETYGLGCDILAVSHEDEFFSASGDECYKIFRTWKVINWCQYDGESDPYIVPRDIDCDGTVGESSFWLLHRPDGYTYFDADRDEANANPSASENSCTGIEGYYEKVAAASGFYQYTQIIKVYDSIPPAVSFTQPDPFCSLDNSDCEADVAYGFSVDEACTPEDMVIKVFLDTLADGTVDAELDNSVVLSGSFPDYTIEGSYPIGNHNFEVVVEDGCGNDTRTVLPFQVIDCKAPAPVCLNGLSAELMPFDEDGDNIPDTGIGHIWAEDFVSSPLSDCTPPVQYSINRVGEPNDPDSTRLELNCGDVGTLVVEIWAYDAAGNSDFCETYVNVQDNFELCNGVGATTASGTVATAWGEGVENVEVSLSGLMGQTSSTDANGAYLFSGLVEGSDYTITTERDGDYANGVSTFDIVLISKHILGLQPLDSPYKRIAADVNNSGNISTLDLIQLRKLILSIETSFLYNTSWRFVDADYSFANPDNPWANVFPEVINLNNIGAGGISNADFVAVKVGDVDGNAQASSLSEVEVRNIESTFELQLPEQQLTAGETYVIPVYAPKLAAIEGYQGTLLFDQAALSFIEVQAGIANESHVGLKYVDEGQLTMSWNWFGPPTASDANLPLFSMVVKAEQDGLLSDLLSISSERTRAEAYGKDGSYQDVGLTFTGKGALEKRFELYQNKPNPFREVTQIGFQLPEAAPATLTISDVHGRIVKQLEIQGVEGYNGVIIERSGLPTGVLRYTVRTPTDEASKSMVITE